MLIHHIDLWNVRDELSTIIEGTLFEQHAMLWKFSINNFKILEKKKYKV